MYKIFISFLFLSLLSTLLFNSSCSKEDAPDENQDYLIFGHYYGLCSGEECVEIFCLEALRLLEDSNDDYPNSSSFYNADFYELSSSQYEEVKDLMDFFPDTLLSINDVVIGQPDAGDWGGLYIEYNVDGNRRFWLLDQKIDNVPPSLHEFIDKVNEDILLINN